MQFAFLFPAPTTFSDSNIGLECPRFSQNLGLASQILQDWFPPLNKNAGIILCHSKVDY
jgi:hypothetical protein